MDPEQRYEHQVQDDITQEETTDEKGLCPGVSYLTEQHLESLVATGGRDAHGKDRIERPDGHRFLIHAQDPKAKGEQRYGRKDQRAQQLVEGATVTVEQLA